MGSMILSASLPQALSMALIKRASSVGWLLPMLKSWWGTWDAFFGSCDCAQDDKVVAVDEAGGTSRMRTMPSTMSSM